MKVCSVYGKCGGCKYLDIDYNKQLENKVKKVNEIFEMNKLSFENFKSIYSSPLVYEYRNKMEYTFGDEIKDGPTNLGLRGRKRKYDVYECSDCLLVDNDFNVILKNTLEFFREKNIPHRNFRSHKGFLRNLGIRKGINTNEIMILLATSLDKGYENDIEEWKDMILQSDLSGKIVSILNIMTDSKANVVKADDKKLLYGNDYFNEKIYNLSFKISPFSFFQTNTKGAELLYEKTIDKIKDSDIIFDLFSGTGTISLLTSQKAKKVYSIEIIKESVESAKENAEINGIKNVEFICGDVKDKIKSIKDKSDYVIFDPPRAGLHKDILKFIIENGFENIIYVSCNPTTLAENLRILNEFYLINSIELVDMFPHTDHVESVVLMTKLEK